MRKQPDFLKDITDTPPETDRIYTGGILSVDDYSSGSRFGQPVYGLQRGGFAAPRFTQKNEQLAGLNNQIDFLDSKGEAVIE